MRTSPFLFLALLGACSSGSQTSTAAPAPAAGGAAPAVATTCPLEVGTTVLSTSFTSSGERASVTFRAGCLYWAATDVSGILLQLRPRSSGTQLPYVGQLMSGGVQGGSTWEIRATIDGEYNIWVTGAPSGRAVKLSVTVRGNNAPKAK
jgi:hypothetical protein